MKGSTILGLLAGIIAGIAIGWFGHAARAERDVRVVFIVNDLERVAFAVNTLNIQAKRPELVEKLQLLTLRSSLDRLEELTREEIALPMNTPSLQEGLRRAASYAKAKDLPELGAKVSLVNARLFGKA